MAAVSNAYCRLILLPYMLALTVFSYTWLLTLLWFMFDVACSPSMSTISSNVLHFLSRQDPKGAVDFLIGRYGDPTANAHRIKSMYGRCRRIFLKNPSNRRADYEDDIRRLMATIPVSSQAPEHVEDYNRLQSLLSASLLDQHRIYNTPRSSYLNDAEADRILHTINPALSFFCDYKLPDRIIRAADSVLHQRRVDRMMQDDGKDYCFSRAEIDAIVARCKSVVTKSITKVGDYYSVIFALNILSGRRGYEIVKDLRWGPGATDFQAVVSGLCKGRAAKSTEEYPIPLLVPYSDFNKAMTNLRAFRTVECASDDKPMMTITSGIMKKGKALIGRGLTHTQRRNIYSEMAYSDRENNGFVAGGCSKDAWITLALCHDLTFRDTTSTYKSMTIA